MDDVVLTKKLTEHVPEDRIILSLSNGETIFEDNIPQLKCFWLRLKEFVEGSDVKIVKFRYQSKAYGFQEFPANLQYYYYIKRQHGIIGSEYMADIKIGCSEDGEKIVGFILGYGKTETFELPIKKGGFGLIRNY